MTSQNRRLPGAARVVLTASASALLAACATSAPMDKPAAPAQVQPAPAAQAPAARPTYGTFGVDTAGMDKSVAPGDSFYRFVNG
ncbi:MAG TPA: M13 family peptidase, partial [Archangium sp.]|nr:M13 family peptidase [Archangium sp.]